MERDRRYIHFPSTRHVFAPVAIGGFHPPKQVWVLLPHAVSAVTPVLLKPYSCQNAAKSPGMLHLRVKKYNIVQNIKEEIQNYYCFCCFGIFFSFAVNSSCLCLCV